MDDMLIIGNKKLSSRLFLGTGKFGDFSIMKKAIVESEPSVITMALRRVNQGAKDDNILDFIPKECVLMPNTSGARDANEAVRIARLAKAAGCGDWVKIEIINDNKYLLPDNQETIKAVEILVKEGFTVLPYMSPDLYDGRRLIEAGAAAVMPLGAPIGSNRGFKTAELVRIMVAELKMPVIVDAGLGLPSHVAECMEMGCAAVLVNTAVAVAADPVSMAKAFSLAVKAGRLAYLSGVGVVSDTASASSPLTGFLRES